MSTERADIRTYQACFINSIRAEGIDFPFVPRMNPETPNSWLIATKQITTDTVLDDPNLPLVLKPDPTSSHYGVHFDGNLLSLEHGQDNAFYVFKRESLAANWLVSPSWEWNIAMSRIADMHNLKVEDMNEGLQANELVQKAHAAYYPIDDLATVPQEVDARLAHVILLDQRVAEQVVIPQDIAPKVRIIDTSIKSSEFTVF